MEKVLDKKVRILKNNCLGDLLLTNTDWLYRFHLILSGFQISVIKNLKG
jgi:hypothetical protein